MTADAQARLMAIQTELSEVRQVRASLWNLGGPEGVGPSILDLLRGILAFVACALGLLGVLLLGLAAAATDFPAAVAMMVVVVPLFGLALWLGRPVVGVWARVQLEWQRLGQREQQLLRENAWLWDNVQSLGHVHGLAAPGAPGALAWQDQPHLPVPPERQPSWWAHATHARFGVGRSPERALRALPEDAPNWKIAFHRSVGWSGLAAIVLGIGMLSAHIGVPNLR